jgi:hypothetical protein
LPESYQLRQNDSACFAVAAGSSILVATLMCLPDAIALIPSVPDFVHWLVRVIGLWLSAAFLWTIGLFFVLKIALMISGPIVVDSAGIRLTRFSKKLRWSWIGAIGVDTLPTVRKAFFLKVPVMRLMIYLPKYEEKGKWIKGSAQVVPSLWFTKEQFVAPVAFASRKSLGIVPNGLPVLIGHSPLREETREIGKQKKIFRILYSAVVAIGIVCVLGRNAVVNYSYNAGNKAARNGQFEEAAENYRRALSLKPAFAMAWHQLALIYWIQKKKKDAENAWNQSLVMRPDLVEAKVGLAYLYTERNEPAKAEKLLLNALRLSPTYVPGHIALADVYLRMREYAKAKQSAELALQMDVTNEQARKVLERIELLRGAHE